MKPPLIAYTVPAFKVIVKKFPANFTKYIIVYTQYFKNITNSVFSTSSCNNAYGSKACGYGNDLIDNGGYYWNIISDEDANQVFGWSPYYRVMNETVISNLNGLRPVLRLNSSVVVTGGTGNYDDPYIIDVK